jgi:hypothetical protein
MKKLFLLAGIAVTLISTSCKKDKVDNNPGGGGNTKLLTKVTNTEAGVVTVHNLAYDPNKRLKSIVSTDNKESIVFSYDGTGNLVKIEQKDETFKSVYTYTYNNGIPVSGAFKSYEIHDGGQEDLIEDDELTYTVTNEQVSNIHMKMKLSGNQEVDFKMTYANGNLTEVETPGTNIYTATFAYGTKKPMFPIVTKWVLDQGAFTVQFAAKHEVILMSYDFPGTGLDNTITTDYTYDSNGYILTSNNGTNQMKFDY